jgi:hypothetical protein
MKKCIFSHVISGKTSGSASGGSPVRLRSEPAELSGLLQVMVLLLV